VKYNTAYTLKCCPWSSIHNLNAHDTQGPGTCNRNVVLIILRCQFLDVCHGH